MFVPGASGGHAHLFAITAYLILNYKHDTYSWDRKSTLLSGDICYDYEKILSIFFINGYGAFNMIPYFRQNELLFRPDYVSRRCPWISPKW